MAAGCIIYVGSECVAGCTRIHGTLHIYNVFMLYMMYFSSDVALRSHIA